MWIATLVGNNVHNGFVNICVLKSLNDISKVFEKIYDYYKLTSFELDNVHSQFGYRIFDNLDYNDRDIKLIITLIDEIA